VRPEAAAAGNMNTAQLLDHIFPFYCKLFITKEKLSEYTREEPNDQYYNIRSEFDMRIQSFMLRALPVYAIACPGSNR